MPTPLFNSLVGMKAEQSFNALIPLPVQYIYAPRFEALLQWQKAGFIQLLQTGMSPETSYQLVNLATVITEKRNNFDDMVQAWCVEFLTHQRITFR